MAMFIKSNGETKNVSPKNGNDYQLDELQNYVGGLIEIIHLGDNYIMVVNEEGLLNNLPLNINASVLSGMNIVGNVILCNENEVK